MIVGESMVKTPTKLVRWAPAAMDSCRQLCPMEWHAIWRQYPRRMGGCSAGWEQIGAGRWKHVEARRWVLSAAMNFMGDWEGWVYWPSELGEWFLAFRLLIAIDWAIPEFIWQIGKQRTHVTAETSRSVNLSFVSTLLKTAAIILVNTIYRGPMRTKRRTSRWPWMPILNGRFGSFQLLHGYVASQSVK
jgi:hypothetical protein